MPRRWGSRANRRRWGGGWRAVKSFDKRQRPPSERTPRRSAEHTKPDAATASFDGEGGVGSESFALVLEGAQDLVSAWFQRIGKVGGKFQPLARKKTLRREGGLARQFTGGVQHCGQPFGHDRLGGGVRAPQSDVHVGGFRGQSRTDGFRLTGHDGGKGVSGEGGQ